MAEECPGTILGIQEKNLKNWFKYKTTSPEKVQIQIANQILEKEIAKTDDVVNFDVHLEKGNTFLITDFIEGKEKYGVYYTYLEYLGEY